MVALLTLCAAVARLRRRNDNEEKQKILDAGVDIDAAIAITFASNFRKP